MNKRKIGTDKEQIAAAYLEEQGVKIIQRNFRNRQGEIDMIAYHGQYLVFVEVKYRGSYNKGNALEAVTYHKQRQICKVADYYRYVNKLGMNTMVRYDVVAIQGEDITWIQNAFPHIYTRG